MKKKPPDIEDLISTDRTASARAFLTELDKTDRIADRIAGTIEVHCGHEEAPSAGDIMAELVDQLGGKSSDTVVDCIRRIVVKELKPLETMLYAICTNLKIKTD